MDVTIVIPTKNAGKLLERVLDMVFKQKTQYSYEVICVDSGSKDGTLNVLNKYPCKVYEILPEEFGHGKTRNFGASKGNGEFIVFITQDAAPANENWLQELVNAMKLDEKIAGGFGIHYPYEDCNIFDRRDLLAHFRNWGTDNTISYIEDWDRYNKEPSYMQHLAYFSDNNSCIRRSIWELYNYPDVDFAEDQIWMRKMMELGYKKVYCPYAAVYHSHNFSLATYYQRYYDEYKGLYSIHGYVVANRWIELPFLWLKHIYRDCKYVHLLPITTREKIYWIYYSICRNYGRYFGGYKGGRYTRYSKRKQEKLDKRFSQQYKQRKA